ncbi:hypothetical protein P280DRAFT_506527 [Massarina eburnea CBS 473.64]|uniref:Uncharacterized protein n=1 Tax=Massarina eburnea CBS 473.64 TaxID=1395130 RepID=A0A6A6S3E9_9PLEO|nr:hypothetical protein P280DRAFT_506527 [Massarina eburnea CBS 473.64]
MGEETLVTFLLYAIPPPRIPHNSSVHVAHPSFSDCPAASRTVELLGSWDNFSKPYQLQRDRRRGHGIWSGCYTFDDIICDGDLSNIGERRSGALKMGGTYWYYYKVDDEEHHNPAQPSTTTCPLLPGQQLNVLEVPRESRSRRSSNVSDPFTRNPQDKFLKPVPPKPLPSPRIGDLCKEIYTVPMHSYGHPKSATYPSTSSSQLLSPGPRRHARSASTSPHDTSTALFCDFKGLKEKFAQKRSAANTHERSRSVRDLEIGAPTLISTTAEDVNLIPLAALRPPPTPSTVYYAQPQTSSSLPTPVAAKLRQFSPLGSNPVDPINDLVHTPSLLVPSYESQARRPRSRSSPPPPPKSPVPTIVRANSSDISRIKTFANQPWAQSPKLDQLVDEEQPRTAPAPVLRRPSLELPSRDARPSSSYGGDRSSSLRKSPIDTDKKLPALPRFLVPAPLFACNDEPSIPEKDTLPDSPMPEKIAFPRSPMEQHIENVEYALDDSRIHLLTERNSHFSLWSNDSYTSTSPTSDDEETTQSPTFSSLTSNCSEPGSPQLLSSRFSVDTIDDLIFRSSQDESSLDTEQLQSSPPLSQGQDSLLQLEDLRLSSFGPSMFLDIQQRGESRRQAACFGYGNFQGYALPEDETMSKATITEQSILGTQDENGLGLRIGHQRESSVSQLERLVDEFGFLGDAVL